MIIGSVLLAKLSNPPCCPGVGNDRIGIGLVLVGILLFAETAGQRIGIGLVLVGILLFFEALHKEGAEDPVVSQYLLRILGGDTG